MKEAVLADLLRDLVFKIERLEKRIYYIEQQLRREKRMKEEKKK